jgi:hypothetical protein
MAVGETSMIRGRTGILKPSPRQFKTRKCLVALSVTIGLDCWFNWLISKYEQ